MVFCAALYVFFQALPSLTQVLTMSRPIVQPIFLYTETDNMILGGSLDFKGLQKGRKRDLICQRSKGTIKDEWMGRTVLYSRVIKLIG